MFLSHYFCCSHLLLFSYLSGVCWGSLHIWTACMWVDTWWPPLAGCGVSERDRAGQNTWLRCLYISQTQLPSVTSLHHASNPGYPSTYNLDTLNTLDSPGPGLVFRYLYFRLTFISLRFYHLGDQWSGVGVIVISTNRILTSRDLNPIYHPPDTHPYSDDWHKMNEGAMIPFPSIMENHAIFAVQRPSPQNASHNWPPLNTDPCHELE